MTEEDMMRKVCHLTLRATWHTDSYKMKGANCIGSKCSAYRTYQAFNAVEGYHSGFQAQTVGHCAHLGKPD